MTQYKMDDLQITAMSPAQASDIAGWTYAGEYAIYSFSRNQETLQELLDGTYYACLLQGEVIGYFCFGQSARIPAVEADAYPGEALDIGLGLKPALCGQGRGYAFVQAGLDLARRELDAGLLRLTVAAFNTRAIRTYEKLGFRRCAEITHGRSRQPFIVMQRNAERTQP